MFECHPQKVNLFECYPQKVVFVESYTQKMKKLQSYPQKNVLVLRWGWAFLERTRILSGIQFTTYFIDFLVVETNRFVGSLVHVIFTRQTCDQRSSRAAESKRRVLGNDFSKRICYMFLISKFRGDPDLGLRTTSVLVFGDLQRNGVFRGKKVFRRRKNRILPLRCDSPNESPEVVHRPRSQSPLHFDTGNI